MELLRSLWVVHEGSYDVVFEEQYGNTLTTPKP